MEKRYTIFIFTLLLLLFTAAPIVEVQANNGLFSWGNTFSQINGDGTKPNKSVVSPNPVKDKAVVRFSNPDKQYHRLEIYDLIGNQVKVYRHVNTSSFDIDVMDLETGMYFYFIMNENERVSTGRLFVRN